MIRVIVVAGVIAALAPAAEARRVCFRGPMRPQVLNPSVEIAGSGGLIVGTGAKFPDWRFRDLNRIVRAHVVKVAPGLAIYHPPPLAGISVVLENESHGILARTERALTVDPVAKAPRVRALFAMAPAANRPPVLAELESPIPAHTLLVIASRRVGDALVPLTWSRVSAGQSTLTVWRSPGGCEETIPDSVQPLVGDKIVLQWVDDAGRISEPSAPIRIDVKRAPTDS